MVRIKYHFTRQPLAELDGLTSVSNVNISVVLGNTLVREKRSFKDTNWLFNEKKNIYCATLYETTSPIIIFKKTHHLKKAPIKSFYAYRSFAKKWLTLQDIIWRTLLAMSLYQENQIKCCLLTPKTRPALQIT